MRDLRPTEVDLLVQIAMQVLDSVPGEAEGTKPNGGSDPPRTLAIAPTQVQDWKLCPTYWKLKHVEGWKPKTVHKWEIQAWIGTGIHAGIAAWCQKQGDPVGVAQAAFAVCQAEALAQGREVPQPEEIRKGVFTNPIEDALMSVRVNTKKFVAQAPAWLQTGCRGVEVQLGSARVDWIGQIRDQWTVVDFKTKRTKPKNLEVYQWGLRRSWQMGEYAEWARIHPDSPASGHQVDVVEVQTIILDQFEVIVDTFPPRRILESERLKMATEMDPTGVVWRNEQHCRNWFGADCPYLRACWDYEGDSQRMTVDYVRPPVEYL